MSRIAVVPPSSSSAARASTPTSIGRPRSSIRTFRRSASTASPTARATARENRSRQPGSLTRADGIQGVSKRCVGARGCVSRGQPPVLSAALRCLERVASRARHRRTRDSAIGPIDAIRSTYLSNGSMVDGPSIVHSDQPLVLNSINTATYFGHRDTETRRKTRG